MKMAGASGLYPALLLLLLVAAAAGSWLDGDDGVDRTNGDLPNMPMKMNSSASPSDCAELCKAESKCVAWVYSKPSCKGMSYPLCYLKAVVMQQSSNPCRSSSKVVQRFQTFPSRAMTLQVVTCWEVKGLVSGVKNAQLLPPVFSPLPLGSIKPQGWLLDQLQLQAESLSGHLQFFWADVMNSSWVGGKADVGLHERTPYWLNGFVPLAYQLQDPVLIGTVEQYVDYILSHQSAEGWLGPDDITDGNAYWSKYPVLFALRKYYEANPSDSRTIPAMMKFLQAAHKKMFTVALGNTWSGARWQDLVLTVHWMLDFHASGQEQQLWDLAELLHQQGFDWKGWYGGSSFPTGPVNATNLYTHGVNNGQAIKSEGVWYRQSHNTSDWQSSYVRMQKLDEFHGQASGIFACDEHLAGKMPSRGTELCTVVESLFSYETLFSIQGDPVFAERAEKLAYNALPATITPDMWAHQYLQQSNEMNAVVSPDHIWTHDGPDATLYGLAPNYGCCTANFNQGWPKFAEHLVMAHSGGEGLVVATYAPASVQYKLPSGSEVFLDIVTDYPFNDTVQLMGKCGEGIVLSLRIPSWAQGATVQVNGTTPKQASPGLLYNVSCTWSTVVLLSLPMTIQVQRRYNNAVSVYRGPLLYALEIAENFGVLESYSFESRDYQVTPGSPWNYALRLQDDSHPQQDLTFVSSGLELGVPPFSLKGAPGKIMAQGRVLDSWQLSHNAAAAPPTSPVHSSNPLTPLTLLPFGATDLRIAELPTLAED